MKSINKFIFATAVLLIIFSACKKLDDFLWPDKNDSSRNHTKRTIIGQLISVKCGTSVINNLWIIDNNGKVYQPCLNETNQNLNEFKNGDHVTVTISQTVDEKSCKQEKECMFEQTNPNEQVTIHRISKTNKIISECGTLLDYTDKLDGCRWVFKSDNGNLYEINNWEAAIKKADGLRLKLSFSIDSTLGSICMVGLIINVKDANSCIVNDVEKTAQGKFYKIEDPSNNCNLLFKDDFGNTYIVINTNILPAFNESAIFKIKFRINSNIYTNCMFGPPIEITSIVE